MILLRQIITGFIIAGSFIALYGCAAGVLRKTPVRDLPDEVNAKISIGDTRKKVRSILGDPLIDARNLGVEAYLHAGRDIDYFMIIYPVPIPDFGKKVRVGILIVYDEKDMVKNVASDITSDFDDSNFRITAGGFRFIGRFKDPETLLGSPISWEELARTETVEGYCSLVLLMGKCPMESISLDNKHIYDLLPAGIFCSHVDSDHHGTFVHSDYHGTFIQRNIWPGNHSLIIHQKTMVKDSIFKTTFECINGETVYAELDAVKITSDEWWHQYEIEGEITIRKSLPEILEIGIDRLSPILWHRGIWYGPSDNPRVGNQ